MTNITLDNSKLIIAKRVSLKDLAEAEHKVMYYSKAIELVESLPFEYHPAQDGRSFPEDYTDITVLIMAYSSRNGQNDWAAYIGLPPQSVDYLARKIIHGQDMDDELTVAEQGLKLISDVAIILFPEFSEQGFTYRI